MHSKYIFKNLSEIPPIPTSHGIGLKQVLIKKELCMSGLEQAAYGFLKAGDKVEEHIHPTMEEFYYFVSGKTKFHIDGDILHCRKGTFVMVPAGLSHFIEVITNAQFIFWCVST